MPTQEQSIRKIFRLEASSTEEEERLAYSLNHRAGRNATGHDVSEWNYDTGVELAVSKAYEYVQKVKAALQLAALELRISRLEEVSKRQEEVIRTQGEVLALLQDKEVQSPPLGDFEKWMSSEAALKFSGMHVGFLEGEGVIASAETFGELLAKLADNDRGDDAITAFVSHGPQ
ncbi:hypothetical protein [Roseimicrobium sp. ORNL1]|uniref:hypothetical protein n=1 Tax=Roseimicrobium sp. ORNL1 TaxID=2711231 RepID=UPI0013E11FAD|nr:hypothetical protein [Roseimicrobium sp. ORNL1]QIF02216.1 hypothetical protein G5S37_11975 [Roseimicrobium sp. ORNL1]